MTSRKHAQRFWQVGISSALAILWTPLLVGAEWNQWRGPKRDGTVAEISIRTELPENGLKPLWLNREDFASSGGWSSPIVADGRVYQYSHNQSRRENVKLPPEKYPPLTDEQKKDMSPEEQQEYEKQRAQESREHQSRQFRFTDVVVCLDAKTGKRVWRQERDSKLTQWRQSSTPAVANGRLYFVGADRQLVCMDTEDGSELWTTLIPINEQTEPGTPEPISSSPLVVEGRVVVQAEQLFAMDAKDGSLVWTAEPTQKGAMYSSPALWQSQSGNRIVANLGNLGTVCVDAANGKELWRVESHAGRSTPVVIGDTLLTYGGSRKGGVRRYEMTDQTAELKWTSNRFADQGSSPVIAGDRVFVQGDRYFACLNLENGEILWQTSLELNQPRYTSPIAAGNQVLYTFGGVLCVPTTADAYTPKFDARISEEGLLASEDYFRKELKLDSLSAAEAEKAWNRHITSQGPRQCVSPAFADGRLYLRLNGGLVCYDLNENRKN